MHAGPPRRLHRLPGEDTCQLQHARRPQLPAPRRDQEGGRGVAAALGLEQLQRQLRLRGREDRPIRHGRCGYNLMTDQLDAEEETDTELP
eukprot:6245913-Pyramimonas_sp.AAC.1